MAELEKTIRVVLFDGAESEWNEWKENFYTKAIMEDYDTILDGSVALLADSNTMVDQAAAKAGKQLQRQNKWAFATLILWLSGVPRGIVKDAKTPDFPKGCAHTEWQCVFDKYESKAADMAIDLEIGLFEWKMKDQLEDPDKWFQCIHHLH